MKINIWSDVRCPFCFVGKKKFEKALEKFPHAEKLEITWHSFQLDPNLVTQPEVSPYEYFAKAKGITIERAKAMHEGAAMAGKEAGIDFNFDDSKVANSNKAHLLIQLSKSIGITEDEAKNALQSDELGYLVKQDMQLAAQLGINAVPFFVINDKYGISGAQQPELFLEALEKTWEEFSNGDKGLQLINSGDSCDIDGNCN